MNSAQAIAALGSLAQETRLGIFRLLVQRGPDGLAAGAIAQRLDVPPATLTFHLHQLLHANLLLQRREGRSVIYAANFDGMNALMGFLTANCCSESGCASSEPDQDRPARRAAAR